MCSGFTCKEFGHVSYKCPNANVPVKVQKVDKCEKSTKLINNHVFVKRESIVLKPKLANMTPSQLLMKNLNQDKSISEIKTVFEKGETSGSKFYQKQSSSKSQNWVPKIVKLDDVLCDKPEIVCEKKVDCLKPDCVKVSECLSDDSVSSDGLAFNEFVDFDINKIKKPKNKKAWVSLFN